MAKFFVLTAILALLASQVSAAPANEVTEVARATYYCANAAGDVCPTGYTCCGPILETVGGTCRKLNPGQVCIF